MILDRLPSTAEAKLIWEALGIPKARHLSDEHRGKLIAAGTGSRFQSDLPAKSASSDALRYPGSGSA
jgi:hypothetical protein